MAIIKPAFKDYEYGFYGFHCSINFYWMNSAYCQNYIHSWDNKERLRYDKSVVSLKKQLPKLKGVIFIYGNYKDCI